MGQDQSAGKDAALWPALGHAPTHRPGCLAGWVMPLPCDCAIGRTQVWRRDPAGGGVQALKLQIKLLVAA